MTKKILILILALGFLHSLNGQTIKIDITTGQSYNNTKSRLNDEISTHIDIFDNRQTLGINISANVYKGLWLKTSIGRNDYGAILEDLNWGFEQLRYQLNFSRTTVQQYYFEVLPEYQVSWDFVDFFINAGIGRNKSLNQDMFSVFFYNDAIDEGEFQQLSFSEDSYFLSSNIGATIRYNNIGLYASVGYRKGFFKRFQSYSTPTITYNQFHANLGISYYID